MDLYTELKGVRQNGGEDVLGVVDRAHGWLEANNPDHWLLPWNMLEILTNLDRGVRQASRLKDFMQAAEKKRYHEVPVTMGLKYLGLM